MKLLHYSLGLGLLILGSCQSPAERRTAAKNDIIFKDASGHQISRKEILDANGPVNYEITTNQNIDPAAKKLHDEARALGQEGKYDLTIAKLEQAIKIQPSWPYPSYDLAYTYLLKGDFANALKLYRKTDALAPKGFFTTKTALYALEGEQSGIFPRGLYTAYLQIEWAKDPAKKLEIARMITTKVPDFAPAWKELALLLNDKTEKLNAIETGLTKHPDADTKGILEINKAILMNEKGNKEEATQILGNLIVSPDATTANVALAKLSLKSMILK